LEFERKWQFFEAFFLGAISSSSRYLLRQTLAQKDAVTIWARAIVFKRQIKIKQVKNLIIQTAIK
jgi:hypothetical protein